VLQKDEAKYRRDWACARRYSGSTTDEHVFNHGWTLMDTDEEPSPRALPSEWVEEQPITCSAEGKNHLEPGLRPR